MQKIFWVDSHSHLYTKSDDEIKVLIKEARDVGMLSAILCATTPSDWARAREVAHKFDLHYAIGVHPYFIDSTDLVFELIKKEIEKSMCDPRFVAIGEIGLDGIVTKNEEKAEALFLFELKLAKAMNLPISMHGRKVTSRLIKYLRRESGVKGVFHAFNGSDKEREQILNLGLALGFGGAITYEGSKRIKGHLSFAPINGYVIESDCPDMPSAFRRKENLKSPQSYPVDCLEYLIEASKIRRQTLEQVAIDVLNTTLRIFPRLKKTLKNT